jgi:hypothetical protein
MPKATIPGGPLIELRDCYIYIPGSALPESKLYLDVLPDISDQKSATYNDEAVIGRASPMKTYQSSDNRSISMTIHLVVSKPSDVSFNLIKLRALQSALYPRAAGGVAFQPPPVCRIRCGELLSSGEVCVILKSCSVKFPTDVSWDESNYCPFKLDVETSWDVVYKSTELPGQSQILFFGK